ncbi:dipeptide epimerase [Microcoleus sp. FACHB-1515]|uniref:dipeptide epimerase n=1 Tax=Cyanophyceae TaxID=3028117 RepID=UPI001682A692|nr:dipeptide epimerase [Microcoleus sp. FACHB-1515]MBD2090037.1 dipeptide epimerase [Microcoleus sp. FACHB-1515]
MQIQAEPFTVHKRFALTISRGTTAESTNIWVRLRHDGIEGWGEASPFSVRDRQTPEILIAAIDSIAAKLTDYTPDDRQAIEPILADFPSAARCAIDLALHDWVGKRANLPLWKLWGLDRSRIVPTSATIGISTPEAAVDRLRHWMEIAPFAAIKVKLGSPDGVEADRAMLKAVLAEASPNAKISIDANGGWSLTNAIAMSHWLAEVGVTYVEQPIAVGQEADLLELYRQSPLPIFVDESCFTSADIPKLSDRVHGINIKLMKSGGLSEALRMVHTAQACGLQIMFGCYSDSAIANTAAAQLAPYADHLDLDSHLNLIDDPFIGAELVGGCLRPIDRPGLGVRQGETKC